MNDIQKSILQTLAYFDIFQYPLTLLELHKYLYSTKKISLDQLIRQLKELEEKQIIQTKNGLYFLPGQSSHVRDRLNRYQIAESKFKARKKILRILCWMPHVKMMAICNSLSYSNAHDKSDIDLFIITDKTYSWTSRFFCTALVSVLNLRPTKTKTKNTICLSFFTSENNINFEKLQYQKNDIYLKYWITQLLPIYDANNYFETFINANKWINNYLANERTQNTIDRRKIQLSIFEKMLKKFLEIFSFDALYKKIQLRALSAELKELKNKDTRVIINDTMLKLYPLDRRQQYYNEWSEKLRCLNLYL